MRRFEINKKVDYNGDTGDYHYDTINLPLVGESIYGEAEFDWSEETAHAVVMHVLPSTAKIVMHEINVIGFGENENKAENYFHVSNCYYLAPVDYHQDGSLKHHQYLSKEAFDSPSLNQQYLHRFPDEIQEAAGTRGRVVGYNSYNYNDYVFKAPYVHDCMHYQYQSLYDRFLLDFPTNTPPTDFHLAFNVRGRNTLPDRPLIFISRIRWFN
jgi:hypothetical protein